MDKIAIAVVMTVFNRMEKTRKCLDSIIAENKQNQYKLSFYIMNDGCTDGTEDMLALYKEENSDIEFTILRGDGKLFWNRGMYVAYGEALYAEPDYYLWVNNDVVFKQGFLSGLLADAENASKQSKLNVICGSVCYTGIDKWSYGGTNNLSKTNPYKRKRILPNGSIQKCDCINGNCLLIPYATGICIGNLDKRYEHGFGDFDYGYRVEEQGGTLYVAADYVGFCDRNSLKGSWRDQSVPFSERIKKKNSPTGQPYKSHKIFLLKWFPKFWLYYLWKPYVIIAITSLQYKMKNK